ncbi:phosphoadenosine phosphosulfate reductase family protein [Tissierella praeacuta]|uniref:phosphoadenosine phosphosulfate reductase family protein n=1 Tax=Tissierella praeacuta TaxID=43131 RepID=UPI003DA3A2D6
MTLGQLNFDGKDKIQVAVDRIRTFEPREGYYLAFSGGKDSIVCKELLNMAGVKYDAHYNNTTADPPELIHYMRAHHPDVIVDHPEITMWRLIPKKLMPPTRIVRYCCDVLKEGGGNGRFVVTGVRWAESSRRKNNRDMVEFDRYGSQSKKAKENRKIFLMSDNEERRMMIENCQIKGKYILNPIIDWTDEEVWSFIKLRNLPYCELYDQGYSRLGCIGCPMQSPQQRAKEFERFQKHKRNYIKAFDRMLLEREKRGLETDWKTGQEVFDWWLSQ